MIEENLEGYAKSQIDKALSYSEKIRQGYIQAKEFEGGLRIKAAHYHIQKQEQGELLANDPLPRACDLAGVDYQTFLKIKAYMPLYTTPQQRTWVGLTEYDIKGVLGLSESWVGEDCSIPDMIGFAKAIQAKLKDRNT